MKLVLLASLIGLSLAAPSQSERGERTLVCYYGSWAVYRPGNGMYDVENIDASLCTHIVFGFSRVGKTHMIESIDPWNDLEENWGKGAYKRFTGLKKQNPGLKAILAVGGWNEASKFFSPMCSSAANRKTFIDSVIDYLPKYGFDGVDLDWEYPTLRGGGEHDKENFAKLLNEMSPALKSHGLIMTAAIGVGYDKIDVAYDIPVMVKNLEYMSLMAYDFHGCWEMFTHHNAPMYEHPADAGTNISDYNIKFGIEYIMELGAPADMLNLGFPLYGRGYTLESPDTDFGVHAVAKDCGIDGPFTRQKGILGWNEICDKKSGGKFNDYFDDYFQAPYSTFSADWTETKDQWYSYDTTDSLRYKVRLANHYNLRGGMVWSIETDDFHGSCGDGVNPLIKAIKDELNGGNPNPPTPEPGTTSTTQRTTTTEKTTTERKTTTTTADKTTTTVTDSTAKPTTTKRTTTKRTTTTKPTTTTTRTTTQHRTTSTKTPSPNHKCKHEGVNDEPDDCVTFYNCNLDDNGNWEVVTFKCDKDTVFNPILLACDFPFNVPGCEDYEYFPEE